MNRAVSTNKQFVFRHFLRQAPTKLKCMTYMALSLGK